MTISWCVLPLPFPCALSIWSMATEAAFLSWTDGAAVSAGCKAAVSVARQLLHCRSEKFRRRMDF